MTSEQTHKPPITEATLTVAITRLLLSMEELVKEAIEQATECIENEQDKVAKPGSIRVDHAKVKFNEGIVYAYKKTLKLIAAAKHPHQTQHPHPIQ